MGGVGGLGGGGGVGGGGGFLKRNGPSPLLRTVVLRRAPARLLYEQRWISIGLLAKVSRAPSPDGASVSPAIPHFINYLLSLRLSDGPSPTPAR